jgi:iron complex transport system substrate-binding protein
MPRIVSLVSSATEIVDALAALPWLVGRSHECDYPEEVRALPACTAPRIAVDGDSREIDRLVRRQRAQSISVYEVFDDVLERLEPTHILTQIQCEVCAVSLRDVERSIAGRLASRPRIVALQPDSLDDVFEDFRRVARALDILERGEEAVTRLRASMEAISEKARAALSCPSVACIDWIEPLIPASNWVPQLVGMAGGSNLLWRTWDDLRAADPEAILVMPCGFGLERAAAEMHWLRERPGWQDLRAVRNGRVCVADGNRYFNRPGPRLFESLRILAEILHPETFPPVLRGAAWKEA